MSQRISVVENILSANDQLAAGIRARLDKAGIFAINLMASPGAGKTSLIEHTVKALSDKYRVAVIDGDIATSIDADRAAAAGATAVQASFQLGVHKNVLIASIPEGDDKPYKYPTMYRGVDALVINKIDLLPYIPFKMDYFRQGVEILNPGLITFLISCQTEEGLPAWLDWIKSKT